MMESRPPAAGVLAVVDEVLAHGLDELAWSCRGEIEGVRFIWWVTSSQMRSSSSSMKVS